MKRKLRTRLDLLLPDVESKVLTNQSKMKSQHDVHARSREFSIGDSVFARNFLGSPKWISAVITRILGPVTYLMELADGRIWKRHVDHLRSKADCLIVQNDNPLPLIIPPSETMERPIADNSVPNTSSAGEPEVRDKHNSRPSESKSPKRPNVPQVQENQQPESLNLPRRSLRKIQTPIRLTDFVLK